MSETKHQGSCHCGNVRYEVELDLEQKMVTCNCSMCRRMGSILAFVPAEKFKLLQGEEDLKDYLFNTKTIHHLFCTTCGIRSFARGQMPDGSPTCAVNLRCVDGVDLNNLQIQEYDGASM